MIDANAPLIVVISAAGIGENIVWEPRERRSRQIVLEQIQGDGVEPVRRDAISTERLARAGGGSVGIGIVYDGGQRTKVSTKHGGSWSKTGRGESGQLTKTFEISEK